MASKAILSRMEKFLWTSWGLVYVGCIFLLVFYITSAYGSESLKLVPAKPCVYPPPAEKPNEGLQVGALCVLLFLHIPFFTWHRYLRKIFLRCYRFDPLPRFLLGFMASLICSLFVTFSTHPYWFLFAIVTTAQMIIIVKMFLPSHLDPDDSLGVTNAVIMPFIILGIQTYLKYESNIRPYWSFAVAVLAFLSKSTPRVDRVHFARAVLYFDEGATFDEGLMEGNEEFILEFE